ncbi:hypothetical protein LTR66_004054 [Elasticomyces elasticus]|nr:hypothetical protein LTR66_004054 [Elasticomyces elasticus]
MAETKPMAAPAAASAPTAHTTATSLPPLPSRHRFSGRQSSFTDAASPSMAHRRSSLLSSSSVEDARNSIRSSADGLLLSARAGHRKSSVTSDMEDSHWHNTPLAFAALPAIAGLLFQNGSAFVTDALLLGLGVLFLYWTSFLPWDWYRDARAIYTPKEPLPVSSIVLEETSEEDHDALNDSLILPTDSSSASAQPKQTSLVAPADHTASAASTLRTYELFALASTFLAPALSAYLLHFIRSQLSPASSMLITNFNLTIFLLAAEIRPFKHMFELVMARTLHLQRIATGLDNPALLRTPDKDTIEDVTARILKLEAHSDIHAASLAPQAIASKSEITDLSVEMRKRYEPRLDALERAVRRYEKRATATTMLTEQRLQDLEKRLQDTLALAAVAASASAKRGIVSAVLSGTSRLFVVPLEIAWALFVWPTQIAGQLAKPIKSIIFGGSKGMKTKAGGKVKVDGWGGDKTKEQTMYARR